MANLKDIQMYRSQVPPAKWSDVLLPPGVELDVWMKKHAVKACVIVEQAELFGFPVIKFYVRLNVISMFIKSEIWNLHQQLLVCWNVSVSQLPLHKSWMNS